MEKLDKNRVESVHVYLPEPEDTENRESKSVEEPSADAAAENKVENAASENE